MTRGRSNVYRRGYEAGWKARQAEVLEVIRFIRSQDVQARLPGNYSQSTKTFMAALIRNTLEALEASIGKEKMMPPDEEIQ